MSSSWTASSRHTRNQSSTASACSLRGHDLNPLRQHPVYSASSLDDSTNFDDILLSVPSAALTHTPTRYNPDPPSPLDNFSQNGHQRSLTDSFFENCRPLVQRATSTIQQGSKGALHSPTKSLASFISLRGTNIPEEEKDATTSSPTKRGSKLNNLFNGASAPISIGLVPSKTPRHAELEEEDEYSEDEMFTSTSAMPTLHRKTTSQTTSSKFSWLLPSVTAKASPTSSPPPSRHGEKPDELLNLNIQGALFPHGPADPLDPSSFNDLLEAAENLLQRYQKAYREQSVEVRELQAEQSAQDEELDEAETRARHLKIQLDDMADRAVKQDEEMQTLRRQLETERQMRIAEEEARLRSVNLVRTPSYAQDRDAAWSPRERKRVSNSSVSDSGFESESDTISSAASINNIDPPTFYSLNRSLAAPSTSTLASLQAAQPQEAIAMPLTKARAPLPRRQSTFDKALIRSGRNETNEMMASQAPSDPSWAQNQGVWNVVRNTREENAMLRRRITELEVAVEETLHLVSVLE